MILPKDFFWLLHTKSERLKDLNTFAGPNAEATFLNFPHRFRHIHRRRYRKDTNTGRWAVGVRRCSALLCCSAPNCMQRLLCQNFYAVHGTQTCAKKGALWIGVE